MTEKIYRALGIVSWRRHDVRVSCVSGRDSNGLHVKWYARLDTPARGQAQEISRYGARLLLWPESLAQRAD